MYINTQNLEQTCWVTMHNFMLSVKFTNSYSRNFPAAGLTNNNGDSNQQLEEDKSILLGDLSSSKLSPEKIGNLYVFSLEMKASATSKTNNDHAVSQFRFGAQTKEEAEEWISAITLAHRQRQQMEALAPPNPHVSINVDEVGDDQAHPLNDNYNGNNSNLSGQQSQEALIVAEDLELTTHWTTDIEQTRLSDFEFHKVLGRGKFAQVILCSQKSTSKVFAVKIVNRNEATGEHNVPVDNESKILRSLVHPFIVGLHFAFQSKDRLYLVMEYVNGGELFFHISNFGRFSEERVQFYSAEIMLAIEFLHSKGILYR